MSTKKAAVYFSAGIGDALLLTPLIKVLKNEGYHVSGIFTSTFNVHELYQEIELLDEKIIVINKPRAIWFVGKFFLKKFDFSIVNFFAANKSNLLMASKTSVKVITNRNIEFSKIKLKNVFFIEPKNSIHDAEQNMLLYSINHHVIESDFNLTIKNSDLEQIHKSIALQIGAGNNKTPFKIWDSNKWYQLLNMVASDFPEIKIILVGDKHETKLLQSTFPQNVTNLIGKTNLNDLPYIIKNTNCFIGSDSGIMHLAVAMGLPTFTIWGASNENIYSYQKFNPDKHQVLLNKNINCRPCNSWINPNKSRVQHVNECPDLKCIKEIELEEVYLKLNMFLKKHIQMNGTT
jgi:ADP-heptose:LPS heptosyltransferase